MSTFPAIGACLISRTLNHVQYKNEPVQQYTTYTHTTNLYTYWTLTTRVEPIQQYPYTSYTHTTNLYTYWTLTTRVDLYSNIPIQPIHIPLTSIHTGHIQLGLTYTAISLLDTYN